ncbi:MAG: glycosyltransferase [Synechococcaceae cyanobacterium]|nr:glycosyltransferase [Synechococcaceae cyanobacterium]
MQAQRCLGLEVRWQCATAQLPWIGDQRACRQLLQAGPPDLVQVHGLWQFPTRMALLLERELPVLITPHGMLDPWALARSRWKKAPVWTLWERSVLAGARCLQALSAGEARTIRSRGLRAPVAVIPNGATLPDPAAPLPPPPWSGRIPPGEKVLLFLGRFHPKKGLEPLLAAWRALAPDPLARGWWLALVGPRQPGHPRAGHHLPGGGVPRERVLVLDPCDGAGKDACLASAHAFVLPSFSEGLPMAALEAMSWRLPCLLSPACNLPEAYTAGAALPVDPTAASLATGLRALMGLSAAERQAMGRAGRALVAERFTWPRVARQTRQLYEWLLGGGEAPDFVEP